MTDTKSRRLLAVEPPMFAMSLLRVVVLMHAEFICSQYVNFVSNLIPRYLTAYFGTDRFCPNLYLIVRSDQAEMFI